MEWREDGDDIIGTVPKRLRMNCSMQTRLKHEISHSIMHNTDTVMQFHLE